ncbi:MAG: hypothetical protein RL477_1667 [Pseudomonadota bacterium]|jgi:tripartite-type tricarboxylate transporter receptor subunit TctC
MGSRKTVIAGIGACALVVAAPQAVLGQSVEAFYTGKTIEFVIGTSSGGSYDQWARMIGRHMGRHIPGRPGFLPKNMPGAGHIRATNYLFNLAPKDGASIGMFSRNIPTSALLKHPSVKFVPAQFSWIGSPELTNRVCVARKDAAVKTAEDLFTKELIVGGAGAGTAVSTTPAVLRGVLGMNFKVVEGYKGASDVVLAIERNEVQGICQTITGIKVSHDHWLKNGTLKVLFNLEHKRLPEYNAPTIYEFAKTEEQRQILNFYSSNTELGRPVAAPPGVPADRLAALRKAFDATMKDAEFRKDAEKQNLEINPLTGAELAERVQELGQTPIAIVDKTEALLGPKPKKKKKTQE